MRYITDAKKGPLAEMNGLNVKKRPELKYSSRLSVGLASMLQTSKKSTHPNLAMETQYSNIRVKNSSLVLQAPDSTQQTKELSYRASNSPRMERRCR